MLGDDEPDEEHAPCQALDVEPRRARAYTLETIASDLKEKSVEFERYDIEGASYADGVHRVGDFRMVWFKDPDGNILHLNSAA